LCNLKKTKTKNKEKKRKYIQNRKAYQNGDLGKLVIPWHYFSSMGLGFFIRKLICWFIVAEVVESL